MMNLSYWERKEWTTNCDFVIIGSGIVGLSCAIELKKLYPNKKVLVLEKGILPQGASTKNAGFACFGSVSELLSDLERHTEEEVFELVKQRWNGLQLLKKNLGEKAIDFQHNFGHELFIEKERFEKCADKVSYLNKLLYPLFKENVYCISENKFGFQQIAPQYISNLFEGQIDSGKMMKSLMSRAHQLEILLLNGVEVKSYASHSSFVSLETNLATLQCESIFIASNGFSKGLQINDVKPARAQVLITKPIANLHIKGTFHLEEGYYYFRNIDNRILLGGGRNLDFTAEETTAFGETDLVQDKLKSLLNKIILPKTRFEIEACWSGIMGVGNQKKPIVQQLEERIFCGVRLGGMGVAIGSAVGKELAELFNK